MIINTITYEDFKTLATRLPNPVVYRNITDGWWSAYAFSGETAVTIVLEQGEPSSFSTDFPIRVALAAPIQLR